MNLGQLLLNEFIQVMILKKYQNILLEQKIIIFKILNHEKLLNLISIEKVSES
jgi:hypothetical protein